MGKVVVPDYFDDFHCKCGECRHPCCGGWNINIDKKEYYSLIGMECGKNLRHRLDDAFVMKNPATDDEYAFIHQNYLGQCPMLDRDGLCLLQKEKGERNIPKICRLYPRAVKDYGSHKEICMSSSCEETVEVIMKNSSPLSLVTKEADPGFSGIKIYDADEKKDAIRFSVISALADPSAGISEKIAEIGGIVGGKVTSPKGTRISAIKNLLSFFGTLSEKSEGIRAFSEPVEKYLDTASDKELLLRFDKAESHLLEVFPQAEAFAARLIANHLFYESFPFIPDCPSENAAFSAFCYTLGILKLMCVCGMRESDSARDFADIIASANKFFEHSSFYPVFGNTEAVRFENVYSQLSAVFSAA